MIALQVASIFARDHNVQVGGIVMIDVPFPDYGHMALLNPDSSILEYGPTAAPNKFERFIFRSVNMLHKWRVSVWRRQRQPYTVKLCASERVSSEGHHHPALFAVDQFRDSLTLGWNERAGPAVVDKSYSIKSHHFGIFEPKNVSLYLGRPRLKQLLMSSTWLGRFCYECSSSYRGRHRVRDLPRRRWLRMAYARWDIYLYVSTFYYRTHELRLLYSREYIYASLFAANGARPWLLWSSALGFQKLWLCPSAIWLVTSVYHRSEFQNPSVALTAGITRRVYHEISEARGVRMRRSLTCPDQRRDWKYPLFVIKYTKTYCYWK